MVVLLTSVRPGMSCWPPSMSNVAPVTAVFVMRWMASAARSEGPTTLRIGRVARSSSRRCSRVSPRMRADRGVSTKPVAMQLARIGASSIATFAVMTGSDAAAIAAMLSPTPGRRACVPVMKISEPPGRTRPRQAWAQHLLDREIGVGEGGRGLHRHQLLLRVLR